MKIIDILRGTVPAPSATALQALVAEAEAEREQLRIREQSLTGDRVEALMGDDDAVIDRIEAELAQVRRAIDRADARIPELRRRQAEEALREDEQTTLRAFVVGVSRRAAAAGQVDAALAALAEAFDEFEAAGDALADLQPFHNATSQGGPGPGKSDRHAFARAVRHHSPALARFLKVVNDLQAAPTPLARLEAEIWNPVVARIAARPRHTEEGS